MEKRKFVEKNQINMIITHADWLSDECLECEHALCLQGCAHPILGQTLEVAACTYCPVLQYDLT